MKSILIRESQTPNTIPTQPLPLVRWLSCALLLLGVVGVSMSDDLTGWYDAEVRAYSVHDACDQALRDTREADGVNPYLTSTGTDGRQTGRGMAGPKWLAGRGFYVVGGFASISHRFTVDDTGPMCKKSSKLKRKLFLEYRFKTTEAAQAFGVQHCRVYVKDP